MPHAYFIVEYADSICIYKIYEYQTKGFYLNVHNDTLNYIDEKDNSYWKSKNGITFYKYKNQFYRNSQKLTKKDNGNKIDSLINCWNEWYKSNRIKTK